MKCPECGETLKAHIHGTQEVTVANTGDFLDVDFECENNHSYFARIKDDDLMESF